MAANGATSVGGKRVEPAALDELFRTTVAQDPDADVVLVKAPNVSASVLVELVDRAKALGLRHFSMATR